MQRAGSIYPARCMYTSSALDIYIRQTGLTDLVEGVKQTLSNPKIFFSTGCMLVNGTHCWATIQFLAVAAGVKPF